MTLRNAFEELAVASKQDTIAATLQAILTELGQKLEEFPADFPDPAVLAKVEEVRALLAAPLAVTGAFYPATQPVSGTVTMANPTADPETGLAKESTLATRASETTLALALAKLNDIFGAVDGLEITAGNIEINSDTLNLALDDVESLLQQIRDNAITEDFAQQATLVEVRDKLETGLAKDTTLTTGFGTDGTTPPLVLGGGTGVRGWLRSIYEKLTGTIAVTGDFYPVTQPVSGNVGVSATDLDIRELSLLLDSVRQTARPMRPRHFEITAGGANDVLTPTAGSRLRILRVDGGCKPSTPDGTYPTYALTLDLGSGVETIRGKELQAGEPIGCTVCFEGVIDAPLTTSVTGPGGTVQFDIYYEEFV